MITELQKTTIQMVYKQFGEKGDPVLLLLVVLVLVVVIVAIVRGRKS